MSMRWNRRAVLRVGGASLFATALAGCSATSGSGGPRRVSMTADFAYDPKRLTVPAGTTVTWVNDSEVGHTVTAYGSEIPDDAAYFASGGFDSEKGARTDVSGGLVATGETYDHTFEAVGTYRYFCVPHESSGMTGTVVVE